MTDRARASGPQRARRGRLVVIVNLAAAITTVILLAGGFAFLLPAFAMRATTQAVATDGRRLLLTLVLAGVAGLVGAVTVGVVLYRYSISPLRDALDRQRRFVTDASHELRAPLTRLHTRTQMMLHRSTDLPESVSTDLQQMVKCTRELGEVIDDLLRSARLWAEPPGPDLVDLGAVAADIIAAEAGRLEERGLAARLCLGIGRPVVPGVESSLRRMVSALVDNAIGHSRAGGHLVVSIDRVDKDRWVELVVADDGVGLDPASGDAIFERFMRGASGVGQRYGIGLALTREVVERHGGTISAAGEPGCGARFTVRLPAADVVSPAVYRTTRATTAR